MSQTKVAHVINSIGLGGVPEAAFQLMRTIPPHLQPRLLVLRPLGSDPDLGRTQRLQRFEQSGIPVAFAGQAHSDISVIGDIARWLTEERVTILHAHSYRPNLLARLAASTCRAAKLRVVAHYHNQYDANWERYGTLELDRHLAKVTDRAIACSGDVRQHITERISALDGRTTVIPNGVELSRFEFPPEREQARRALNLPSGVPIVGLVGRLSRQKGQDILIRAAAQIRLSHPAVLVALAGAPDSPDQLTLLETLATELGLSDAIRFLGFISDMPGFYAAVDAIAAPSRWEGFGLMLVEAMAAGTPVVAARAGAIPEVAGDERTMMLVTPDDPFALASAISAVLSDTALSCRLSERGRSRARDFQWERSGKLLGEVYDELLTDRRS